MSPVVDNISNNWQLTGKLKELQIESIRIESVFYIIH